MARKPPLPPPDAPPAGGTVQRPFKADRMAALVVERAYAEPARIERLKDIPSVGRTERRLAGTPDVGKL